jgi:hypothetical protein
MRIIFLMTLTAVLVPVFGQTNPEGLSCYENLAAPEFPRAALEAHIDGTVWTTTQVNPQGGIEKIETQVVSAWGDGPKLLTPPVETVIRAAKIKPACAGKSVAAIFRYQLHGEATASPNVTTRTEGNLMWIESQPATGVATKTPH